VPDKLDGVDLLPHLSGKVDKAPHEILYWRYGGQWALRQGNWKLVKIGAKKEVQLFDLATDIGESKDLAAQKPELVNELREAYRKWNAELAEPLWGGAKKKKQTKQVREFDLPGERELLFSRSLQR
jgi:arylsulfatase A-like enzyme